ncbi:MAG: helix-turn-helix domain-containing protein [Microthrixaceae bacterium]
MATGAPAAGGSADTAPDVVPDGAADDPPDCSIGRALDVIGDRWTILILRDAFRGIRRFEEFRRDLGIARPVLTERLKRLVDAGVMVRRRYQTGPDRYEYRLTRKGVGLSPALVALMRWGDTWCNDGAVPTVLVHEPCGVELEQGFWCRTCQCTFGPHDIASRHRPTATPTPHGANR